MSNSNGSIRVTELPNRGRSLVSCRPLKAGEIILKDSPLLLYSAVPQPSPAAANYCTHCFRSLPPHSTILPCPNCPTSLFCSVQCQSVAISTSHTPFVCQSLARLFAADSPLVHCHYDRQLQARFLVSAYNLALTSPAGFQTLLSLQGESIGDDETVVLLHTLISQLIKNNGSFGVSVELTGALLAKDKLNAFGLMENFDPCKERSVRAYGIYPMASFFNHDCLPNVCRFDYVDAVVPDFSNVDITVRVIHDLPEGREVCVSYFPVTLKYAERQKRLREDYGFTCDCDRCKVEANWSDDEDEGEMDGDEEMDEDVENGGISDAGAEDGGMGGGNDDFPHAYFFARYMCNRDNCGGTLAPLPPSGTGPSIVMECNFCGNLSKSDDMI